jgi:hypothetical protein
VKRGEFYLDMNCVKNWCIELAEMNHKKHGSPFKYPKSFILVAAIIYSFMRMPYRQLEGHIGKLSTFIPGLKNADYTTLWRRITTMPIPIPPFSEKEDVVVAVDSTGFKVTNRGDWMREKHGKERRARRCHDRRPHDAPNLVRLPMQSLTRLGAFSYQKGRRAMAKWCTY